MPSSIYADSGNTPNPLFSSQNLSSAPHCPLLPSHKYPSSHSLAELSLQSTGQCHSSSVNCTKQRFPWYITDCLWQTHVMHTSLLVNTLKRLCVAVIWSTALSELLSQASESIWEHNKINKYLLNECMRVWPPKIRAQKSSWRPLKALWTVGSQQQIHKESRAVLRKPRRSSWLEQKSKAWRKVITMSLPA